MGERIKDLIYDFSDIIISLVIITMIFGVVSWKISDSMAYTQFTGQPTNAVLDKNDKDAKKDEAGDQASANTGENTGENPADTQGSGTGNTDSNGNNTNTNTAPPANTAGTTPSDTAAQGGKPTASAGTTAGTTTPPASTGVSSDVKVVIPAGSAGITIAKILKEQGIITDTKAFISRVDALKMGPKLKAGTFTIKAGSSMDDVIYTIAGKK